MDKIKNITQIMSKLNEIVDYINKIEAEKALFERLANDNVIHIQSQGLH